MEFYPLHGTLLFRANIGKSPFGFVTSSCLDGDCQELARHEGEIAAPGPKKGRRKMLRRPRSVNSGYRSPDKAQRPLRVP